MSYNPNNPIDFQDKLKAGGSRLQVSEPVQLFEDRHNYGLSPLLWENDPDNNDTGDTITHLTAEAGVSMSITGNSGDKASRQTFEHFTYTPSKPMKFEMATIFPAETTNLRVRVGCFTASDGFFLEQADSTVSVVRRTNVSGTPDDSDKVAQSSWNLDTLDGSGDANNPSGKTLNLQNINLIAFEYLWYGAGPCDVIIELDGEAIPVHRFQTAGAIAAPLTATGNLPLRYEIENTGITSVTSVLKTYGASVVSEGGQTSSRGYLHSASSGTVAAATSRTHAISIRPNTTFNSVENRVKFELESVEVLVTGSDSIKWEVCYGQGFGNTPSWDDVNASNSAFEINTEASTTTATISGSPSITGPSGFTAASTQTKGTVRANTKNVLPVCLDAAGNTRSDGTLTIAVTSLGASGTSNCRVLLNWREVY